MSSCLAWGGVSWRDDWLRAVRWRGPSCTRADVSPFRDANSYGKDSRVSELLRPFHEPTAAYYGNIVDEAKIRLHLIETALQEPPKGFYSEIAVSDLCALQFRKVFEAIALGCLLIHGDLPGSSRMRKDYRADLIIKGLERLHPNFYPVPCQIIRLPNGGIKPMLLTGGEYLNKARLKKAYTMIDEDLHVGKLKDRTTQISHIERDSLAKLHLWTSVLVRNHVIQLRDPRRWIIAQARELGTPPLITIQTRLKGFD